MVLLLQLSAMFEELRVTLASILLEVPSVLVHPNFDPVAIHLGPLAVRWYGLMYLVGFGTAFWLGRRRIARSLAGRVDYALLDDLLFYGVLGVVLGGRLGYVLFYKPAYYFSNLLVIPAVWRVGMSFHGGFLGVLLAVWCSASEHLLGRLEVSAVPAPVAPLAFAASWLPNRINGG